MIEITEERYAELLQREKHGEIAEAIVSRSIRLANVAREVVDVYKRPFVWRRKDALRRLENELEGKP